MTHPLRTATRPFPRLSRLSTLLARPGAPARLVVLAGLLTALAGCDPADPPARGSSWLAGEDATLLHRILIVQDARDTSRESLRTLRRGLLARPPEIRVMAARAVGRMESPDLIPLLAAPLSDPDPRVRAEAANAVAQAAYVEGAAEAADVLLPVLRDEADPEVRGVIALSLGRLPFTSVAEIEAVEEGMADVVGGRDLSAIEERGLVLGAARLALRRRTLGSALSPFLRSRLGGAAYSEDSGTAGGEFVPDPAAYARRAALDGLIRTRAADATILASARLSPDPEVRRLAATGTPLLLPAARDDILDPLLLDPDPAVRYDALRAWATAGPASALRCAPLVRGLDDASVHVRVLAASAPGASAACIGAPDGPAEGAWIRLAASLREPDGTQVHWQVATAALSTLARLRPGDAAPILAAAAGHPLWQVRMASAGVAGAVGDEAALRDLATDPDHNVREAALRALGPLAGRGADDLYLDALGSRDPQLVMTAAGLLEGTPDPDGALGPLLESLEWFNAFGGETSRDARVALLDRIGGVVERGASAERAASPVEPLVEDVDPVVAEAAAGLLSAWTGHAVRAHPGPRRVGTNVPSPGTLLRYSESRIVVEMSGGGRFVIALHPFQAPTNTHRLVTQALGGTVDGLTLHRVVPNFVVQGLSPGANEYWGHGGFTRDEVGLMSNLRGTVGLSTRGRDSGDGQIYVNLVDNLRLDHTYTVFGTVVEGMDVVDELTPGAVVATVTLEGPAAN